MCQRQRARVCCADQASFAVLYRNWSWGRRGMEYALFMGIVPLAIFLRGGGRWSLDRLIGREF